MRSFFSMCSALVAMKVWMRELAAPFSASAAREMSRSLARASEQTVDSFTCVAIARTASKSPLLEAAKPASMMSTRSRSSWRAMRSFSSLVIEAPGDCSPSRSVVSKMISLSLMVDSWLDAGRVFPILGERRGFDAACAAPDGAMQARDDRLERGRDDVGVDADAEQRHRLADSQLEVGHCAGVGAAADGVLVVVEHTRARRQPLVEAV